MRDIRREDLLAELAALRPALERDGVRHLTLFGSRARQDHRPDSDVDVMIEVDEAKKFSMLDVVGVAHTIEDKVGLPANIFMRRSLDQRFLESARSDLIEVF